jgi:large subunit ribosomal protein L35
MPKMKTSKTAAKRFRKTGTGKLRRLQANRQHLFEHKPSTRTRRLAGEVDVHPGDARRSSGCSRSADPPPGCAIDAQPTNASPIR